MDLIVTGATGFLGRALVKRLLRNGHRVWAVARPGSKNRELFEKEMKEAQAELAGRPVLRQESGKGVSAGTGNGRPELRVLELGMDDCDHLAEAVGRPCQVFFHLGWDGAGSENRKKTELQWKNVPDSMKALQAARELGCGRFLFSGSQAEYGVCSELITEETVCRPVSEYGKAKAEFGRRGAAQVRDWAAAGVSDMDFIHARIFSVYGPGDHPWSLVNSCLRTFRDGGVMELGACTQMWNFLYIDDLAEGLLALAFSEKRAGGIYNLAGDRDATMPLRNYVETMYRLCGEKGSMIYGKLPPNAEGQAQLMPDISKIKRETGWRPQVSFEQGIGRMLALSAAEQSC